MTFLKLLLMRHGQSWGNAEGRMEGWSSTGLTPLGQWQARQLGMRLAREGRQPTHIYCSPLGRAAETLETMTSTFKQERVTARKEDAQIPTEFRDNLKEYNNGVLAGLTWAEARGQFPDLCASLEQSLDWLPIPGGETLKAGRQRAQGFMDELLDRHQNGDEIWVISHHWILQQLIACLMGCDRTWGFSIHHTGIFEFWLDRSRWYGGDENRYNTELWQLKRFNDCEHCHA
jgi:2,3-bisphosphoglycerate-dependent phosphoglycerate mutase